MALTNDQITAQNFKDFYGQIRPYLNGQVPTFANQFSRSDLYSTSEKIIGCWTDGKPLYQKSYVNVTVPAANSNSIVESNFNADTFWVSCLGIAVPNEMAKYSDGLGVFVFINDPDGHTQNLSIGNTSASRAGNKACFTVCYTKTGDSAIKVGTGTDYSTEEQIIGTWIDGKPLYQKTFSGTVSSANSISYVSIGASVDTFVDGRGVLNNSVPLIGITSESVSAGVTIFVNTNSAASNKNTFGVYSKPESQSAWVGTPYYLTLCYTKSTD